MGLDGVELVMAFEEAFGISISDADAAAAVTPGMVVDLVCRHLERTDARTCQTQRAFYLLRRALMSLTQKPRSAIAPTTPLRDLFDTNDARVLWPQLKAAVDARSWPHLVRPRWARNCMRLTFIVFLLGSPFLLHSACPQWSWADCIALAFLIIAPLSLLGVAGATRGFKRSVVPNLKTVADLTNWVLTSKQVLFTRESVRQMVKQIVIAQLGIPEAKYSEDAHFVRDLGVD